MTSLLDSHPDYAPQYRIARCLLERSAKRRFLHPGGSGHGIKAKFIRIMLIQILLSPFKRCGHIISPMRLRDIRKNSPVRSGIAKDVDYLHKIGKPHKAQ